jgi:uncharacterized protein (UPF0371 family)
MQGKGFDTGKYLAAQTRAILERTKKFDERLYLEFGGKLCHDPHAARVLPGYELDTKIKMFKKLGKDLEIIYCVSAKELQRGKVMLDLALTYDQQTLKDINELHEEGIDVFAVVITRFEGEEVAKRFKQRLENLGIRVYVQTEMEGYPENVDFVVSDEGFGAQPFLEIEKPLVVVTGAGGGSGKMCFCLSQLYHDYKRGINSGFAKFETFPIWDLPPNHPVNVAYEAATADLGDEVMIDPYHLRAYEITAASYNRDIENFEIMKSILKKIVMEENFMTQYRSPTDVGVNKAKEGIIDEALVREAAKQEIIRRYFQYKKGFLRGVETRETVERAEGLMKKIGLKVEDRKTVLLARNAALEAEKKGKGHKGVFCGAAIELPDGRIVTGKNSPLLHAESAAVLNAVKTLANIPDEIHLLSSNILENIADLKKGVLNTKSESLNVEGTLISLAISAATNPTAAIGIKMLEKLRGCEMHVTHMPSHGDEAGLRKLGLNVTTDGRPTVKYVS